MKQKNVYAIVTIEPLAVKRRSQYYSFLVFEIYKYTI